MSPYSKSPDCSPKRVKNSNMHTPKVRIADGIKHHGDFNGKPPLKTKSGNKSNFVYEDVLNDVVVYVEVRSEMEDLSKLFGEHLLYLGATVASTLNKKITHVVFKGGRESTFQKATKRKIPVVSVVWVDRCKTEKRHVEEEPFLIKDYKTYGKRKRLLVKPKQCDDDLSISFEESKKIVESIKLAKKHDLILAPETPAQSQLINRLQSPEVCDSPMVVPETIYPSNTKPKTNSSISPVKPIKRKLFIPSRDLFLGLPKESTPLSKKPCVENPVSASVTKRRKDESKSRKKENKDTLNTDLRNNPIKKSTINIMANPTSAHVNSTTTTTDICTTEAVTKCRKSLEDFVIRDSAMVTLRRVREVRGDKRTLVFTSMDTELIETVYSVVKSLGGFQVINNVNKTTTHIICGENKRTLNVLYGLVQGCFLLSTDWLMKSLDEGRWLEEQPYEIPNYPSATIRQAEMQYIFRDCGLFFVSPDTSPPAHDLTKLITLGGGVVTTCFRKCHVVVGNFKNSKVDKTDCEIIYIEEKLVLDCISGLKVLKSCI